MALRCDAFEHLQLPFTLRSGRIGRIQAQVRWRRRWSAVQPCPGACLRRAACPPHVHAGASTAGSLQPRLHDTTRLQVPWATLRSLRSPVIVELADVHLCVVLRRDEELEEGPAGERAWLAKQAELAAAELAALAAASAAGGADADAAAAAAGRQGGVLASFMQHVVAMLVNRLQLTVSGVHIQFEVGRRVGWRVIGVRWVMFGGCACATLFWCGSHSGCHASCPQWPAWGRCHAGCASLPPRPYHRVLPTPGPPATCRTLSLAPAWACSCAACTPACPGRQSTPRSCSARMLV